MSLPPPPDAQSPWRRALVALIEAHNSTSEAVEAASRTTEDLALGVPGSVPDAWRVLREAVDALSSRAATISAFATQRKLIGDGPEERHAKAEEVERQARVAATSARAWVGKAVAAKPDLEGAERDLRAMRRALIRLRFDGEWLALEENGELWKLQETLGDRARRLAQVPSVGRPPEPAAATGTMIDRAAAWVTSIGDRVFSARELLAAYHGGEVPDLEDVDKAGRRVADELRGRRGFVIESMRDIRRKGEVPPASKGYIARKSAK